MKSLVQPDIDILTLVAPAGGVTVDVPTVVDGYCVIPVASAAAGEEFAGRVRGVFDLPKATGAGSSTGMQGGDTIEWDASAAQAIADGGASGDFDVGTALYDTADSDDTVRVVKSSPFATVNP